MRQLVATCGMIYPPSHLMGLLIQSVTPRFGSLNNSLENSDVDFGSLNNTLEKSDVDCDIVSQSRALSPSLTVLGPASPVLWGQ